MRVLITQGSLHRLSGSEVVTYELAEHFSHSGAEVAVATHSFNGMWHQRLTSLPGVRLFGVSEDALEDAFTDSAPDVAWIHHSVVPQWMLTRRPERVVFHHMSTFHPLEFPLNRRIEQSLGSVAVFPSPEALDFHSTRAQFLGQERLPLQVFGNPAPDRFFRDKPRRREGLGTILVVSNHVPSELREALVLLQSRGIKVRVFGEDASAGDTWEMVEPNHIDDVDAVITIGKTVQYALVAGVPVFCYDHFGGPGWLSPANFERARHFNFSGRGFDMKSAELLVSEMEGGWRDAALHAAELHGLHARSFLYSHRVPEVLAHPSRETPHKRLDDADIEDFLAAQSALGLFIDASSVQEGRVRERETELANVRAERDGLKLALDEEKLRSQRMKDELHDLRAMGARETFHDYLARRRASRSGRQ